MGKRYFTKTTILVLITAFLAGIFALYEIQQYEESILDVYADQQDGYVKLVLDQILLQGDSASEETILKILETLDSSSNKYWTLAQKDALLFVKDVTETNRYKGFTTESYYISDSATEFLQGLVENRVSHKLIDMNGSRYIASGVLMDYHGTPFRICLLTYDSVILENNMLLRTRITMTILILGLLMAILVISMGFSHKLDEKMRQVEALGAKTEEQNLKILSLVETLRKEHTYNPKNNIFHESVLETFLEKLDQRKAIVIVALFDFKDDEQRMRFIERNQLVLERRILRFGIGERRILLLFTGYGEAQARKLIQREMKGAAGCMGIDVFLPDYDSYVNQYHQYIERIHEL